MFLLYPVTFYVAVWPSLSVFGVYIFMMSSRFSNKSAPREDEEEKHNLSAFFVSSVSLAPAWLKSSLANLHVPIDFIASTILEIEELLQWQHPWSTFLSRALLILSLALLFIPFWITLYVFFLLLLIPWSPFLSVTLGLVDFFWRPRKHSSSLKTDFDYDLLSKQARKLRA
jgi:hypothetical protein